MKLNLGCGFDKREGFINADHYPACEPDVLMDIEQVPWPFEDNQFEYVLLKGVNDSPEHARELARRIQGIRGKVNLLPFNPHEGAPYQRPADEAVERFRLALRAEGVDAYVRKSRGRDIAAACGQLALAEKETSQIVPLRPAKK